MDTRRTGYGLQTRPERRSQGRYRGHATSPTRFRSQAHRHQPLRWPLTLLAAAAILGLSLGLLLPVPQPAQPEQQIDQPSISRATCPPYTDREMQFATGDLVCYVNSGEALLFDATTHTWSAKP